MGYIIVGYTNESGLYFDVYLLRTDIDGNVLWTKILGGANNDFGFSVQQTVDGGFIIAGYSASFGAGGEDVYLIKTDANGDTLWTKTIGGTNDDWGSSVQQISDGGYIIVGSTNSYGAGMTDVWLITLKTETIIEYGDVDGNGEVQAYDAALTLQYSAELIEFEDWQLIAADVDGNGEVQAYDAALILQYSAGLIDEFPVEGEIKYEK